MGLLERLQNLSRPRLALVVVVPILVLTLVLGLAIGIPVSMAKDSGNSPVPPAQQGPQSDLEKAIQMLQEFPLIDGHNDLPYRFRDFAKMQVWNVDLNSNMSAVWPYAHTDIPRLRQGLVGGQFWACWVPCESQDKDALRLSLEQLDVIKKYIQKYPDTFQFVVTADGIMEAFNNHKIASLIGLEGGHSIDNSLGALRMFYDLGVRYMTLTHSCNTPWADNSNEDDNRTAANVGGLTSFGETVVKEMNRLGMLVDLAHVAKVTMVAALRVSRAPVIFSHSSAFQLCNHHRNVQDDVLRLTMKNGGVVMVNFYPGFVSCQGIVATLSQVADHIEHIRDVTSIDNVGIGADYDGFYEGATQGLEDVSKYPNLFAELIRRGWSKEDLRKLAGANIIRVFKKAEEVRDQMASEGQGPFEDLIPKDMIASNACLSNATLIKPYLQH